MSIESPLFVFIFLFSASLLSGMNTALQRFGKLHAKKEFPTISSLFFFHKALKPLFGNREWEGLLFTINIAKFILTICYTISAFFFLLFQPPFDTTMNFQTGHVNILYAVAIGSITVGVWLLFEYCVQLFATAKPQFFFRARRPLRLGDPHPLFSLSALLLNFLKRTIPKQKTPYGAVKIRDKILEILQESELPLDDNEQKLILSIASFKDRMAREVMVPRIDVFSLPSDTTLQEAIDHFLKEGYSRIPIYRDTVDHIIGVLLYKDILKHALNRSASQDSIEKLIKPVLYTPETKKISHLLQEFRGKQIHLAIVVDEYGGTEGIVTIEDILEELVGEIADEYDIDQELLFSSLPAGGWVVDAKMGIVDIEEDLGVKIPQSPEYDTIGGYIFHRAAQSPPKGGASTSTTTTSRSSGSDERSIEKIRITPHVKKD